MRTAAIDGALGRFAAGLEARLGPAVEVRGARVSFDTTGWSVRCDAHERDGGDALELCFREGAPFALGVAGEPRIARGLAGRIDGSARDAVAEAIASLLREVEPRAARSEPLDGARARGLLGEDGALLAPWIDGFARHYGEPLRAVFLEGDGAPSIGFPDVARGQAVFMHAPPPFREDARMRGYLADLGFEVDARAQVSTVPVPSSFARRRARVAAAGGFRPRLVPAASVLLSPVRWLSHIAEGALPINVHGALAHALSAPARRVTARLPRGALGDGLRARWNNHFHALGHDMGLHVLAMHRIGASQLARLRAVAREALRAGRGSARRAAGFFEERLTRACCDLWIDVRDAGAFEARFERAMPSLIAELRREAGLPACAGSVRDGDARDGDAHEGDAHEGDARAGARGAADG